MNKFKHYITTLGGAIVLVWAFTAPSHAQRYSDWSAPINLGPTVNSAFVDRGPAISKDGLSLYFASTRPDGFGGEDIYVSQRETRDGEWGPPVNLGPIINTTAGEMVPAFSRDGHFLFFASSRPGGFGAVDIWVSWREDTHDDFAWQTAENLGAGVNSTFIDAGPSYFANDEVGVPQLYFNSNRPGGLGTPNIYISEQTADGSFGAAFLVLELSSLGETSRSSIRHDGREIFFNSSSPVGPDFQRVAQLPLHETLASQGFIIAVALHSANAATRVREVSVVVNVMLARSATVGDLLTDSIDQDKIGVSGSSAGGAAAIGAAGGWAADNWPM